MLFLVRMPHNVDLNLATLPVDIITNIIRMDEESLESMHLVNDRFDFFLFFLFVVLKVSIKILNRSDR